jgi:hypothetical protein
MTHRLHLSFIPLSLFLLALHFTPGTLSAQSTTETRTVSNFSKLRLDVPATLYLSQGETEELKLEGDASYLEKIETTVDGDKLVIKSRRRWSDWNWWSNRRREVKIYLTMKTIRGISISGSGDIVGKTPLTTDDVTLSVSGSGDMKLALTGKRVNLNIAGSGDLDLSGSAENAVVSIAGSGDVSAKGFSVSSCRASIAGSGDCTMSVSTELSASIVGSGDVQYLGSPHVKSSVMGSGSVEQLRGATATIKRDSSRNPTGVEIDF